MGGARSDFLLMVKPVPEIGKERLGHGVAVRNPETMWKPSKLLRAVPSTRLTAIAASPLPGPSGNVEY